MVRPGWSGGEIWLGLLPPRQEARQRFPIRCTVLLPAGQPRCLGQRQELAPCRQGAKGNTLVRRLAMTIVNGLPTRFLRQRGWPRRNRDGSSVAPLLFQRRPRIHDAA